MIYQPLKGLPPRSHLTGERLMSRFIRPPLPMLSKATQNKQANNHQFVKMKMFTECFVFLQRIMMKNGQTNLSFWHLFFADTGFTFPQIAVPGLSFASPRYSSLWENIVEGLYSPDHPPSQY